MTEGDEKLHRRYRGIPREEPSGELDAAILAKARRSVARRDSRRWMMPVSIAAVLVLSVGLVLRMQLEKPGVETAVSSAEYPVPPSAQPDSPAREAAPAAEAARAPKPLPSRPREAPPAVPKPKILEAPERRREPSPFPGAAAPPVPAAPSGAAREEASAAATTQVPPAPRAKRELQRADDAAARAPIADPQRELERIAELRREGRHEEADRALERFGREHPDYRIPATVWERVKPR